MRKAGQLQEMRSRQNRIIAFSTAIALVAMLGAGKAGAASAFRASVIDIPEAEGPEAQPFAAGPNILLGDHWYKFDTDSCGLLQRMETRRSMTVRSQFDDDDGFDDGGDPSDDGRNILSQWLSTHSEIAVISDGVDKWCGDDWFDDEDSPSESIA